MRYAFKFILCFTLIFVGFLLQVNAENKAAQYKGLCRKFHLSPDGRHNAIIVENKYPHGSEYSLHLITMNTTGYEILNDYSLTPRYSSVIQTPDGNIAFVTFDTVEQYKVHTYNPKKLEIGHALEYADHQVKQIQFSKDMRTCGIYQDFSAHPLSSKKQKQSVAVNRAFFKRDGGWIIITEGDYAKTQIGDIIFSDKEKENYTEWAPIEKPKKIPEVFTQPMPIINLETQISWSHDSNHIYVLDKKGIWRLSLGPIYFPIWTLLIKQENIIQFEPSPFGKMLLYKTIPDPTDVDYLITLDFIKVNQLADPYALTFDIWLVSLMSLKDEIPNPTQEELILAGGPVWLLDATPHLSPRKLTRALEANFNPIGGTIEISTLIGQYGVEIKTLESEVRSNTGFVYD